MIVYLRGADSYQAIHTIAEIKKKFVANNPEGEVVLADIPETVFDWANLRSQSFFALKRLFIIKRANLLLLDQQKILANNLPFCDEHAIVVVWNEKEVKVAPELLKSLETAKQIDCQPYDGLKLKAFVDKKATQYGLKLTSSQAQSLTNRFGADLWAIDTELSVMAQSQTSGQWSNNALDAKLLFNVLRRRDYQQGAKMLIELASTDEPSEKILGLVNSMITDRDDQILDRLMDVDFGSKVGLIDNRSALLLMADCLLNHSKNRLQWEMEWQKTAS